MASICVGLVVVDGLLLEELVVQHLAAAQEKLHSTKILIYHSQSSFFLLLYIH